MSTVVCLVPQTPELIRSVLYRFGSAPDTALDDIQWVINECGWDLAVQCAREVSRTAPADDVFDDTIVSVFINYADRRLQLMERLRRAVG